VQHKIIYADADYIEDTGSDSLTVSFTALLYSGINPAAWATLSLLINMMKIDSSANLSLPDGQIITARLKSISETYAIEHRDGVAVDLVFVEDLITFPNTQGIQTFNSSVSPLPKLSTPNINAPISPTSNLPIPSAQIKNINSQIDSINTNFNIIQSLGQANLSVQQFFGKFQSGLGVLWDTLNMIDILQETLFNSISDIYNDTTYNLFNTLSKNRILLVQMINALNQEQKASASIPSIVYYVTPQQLTVNQVSRILKTKVQEIQNLNPGLGYIIPQNTILSYKQIGQR
jgi:hypothetical protein